MLLLLALLARVRRGGGGSFAKLSTDERRRRRGRRPDARRSPRSRYRRGSCGPRFRTTRRWSTAANPGDRLAAALGLGTPPGHRGRRASRLPGSRLAVADHAEAGRRAAAGGRAAAAALPPPPSSAASGASAFARQLLRARAGAARSARVRGDGRAQEALAQLAKLAPLVSEEAARRKSHEPR